MHGIRRVFCFGLTRPRLLLEPWGSITLVSTIFSTYWSSYKRNTISLQTGCSMSMKSVSPQYPTNHQGLLEVEGKSTIKYLQPLFVFPRVRMKPELMDGTPPGAVAEPHQSGWMQSEIFVKWFEHFCQHRRPPHSGWP